MDVNNHKEKQPKTHTTKSRTTRKNTTPRRFRGYRELVPDPYGLEV